MVMKNTNTQKLGNGSIDNALGKILKLNDGPDNTKSLIFMFYSKQKWPMYIKILKAHRKPQATILNGMRYSP